MVGKGLMHYSSTGDLVVYGSSLEAYTTVQSLLQHGLPPSRLTLVQPRPLQALNNTMVEERVGSALGGLGLGGMYRGYTMEGWTEEGEGLLTVQFAAPGEGPLSLNCKVLIGGGAIEGSWSYLSTPPPSTTGTDLP